MIEFIQRFSTDEDCRAFMEAQRWPEGPVCPKCGSVNRSGRVASRPGVWTCNANACKRQFTVTAGTPLHRTRVPLPKWFLAIWLVTTSSKGVSGMKLAEWIDVDYRTAWYMGHRIRKMLVDPMWDKLTGIVEADEVYVGGRKKPEDTDHGPGTGGSKRGRGHGRAVVLVAVERGDDDCASRVATRKIATHSKAEIGQAMQEVASAEARLITDGLPAYRSIGRDMSEHHVVDHGRRKFSLGNGIHVNSAEGFIGMFRRAVQGTWHWVSCKHVEAYSQECAWRHGRTGAPAMDRFRAAFAGLSNGPLGFRSLTA